MSVSILDSEIFGDSWADPDLKKLFGDENRIAEWVYFIKILAVCQGELGSIPSAAAERINVRLTSEKIEIQPLRLAFLKSQHSVAGLLALLRESLLPEDRQYLARGCTVQDISDSTLSRQILQVSELMQAELAAVLEQLARLCQIHRSTPQLGRTHGQAGSLISFGLKCAQWLDDIDRCEMRLKAATITAGMIQLAGSVGSAVGYGEKSTELRNLLGQKLGLSVGPVTWTSSRQGWSDFLFAVNQLTTALGRIGNEIYCLQKSGIEELQEPAVLEAYVGSITMPFKRNPERAEHLVTLARCTRGSFGSYLESGIHEHERDGRSWKGEWKQIPEILAMGLRSLRLSRELLSGLEVRSENMARNIQRENGRAFIEAMISGLSGLKESSVLSQELSHICSQSKDSHQALVQYCLNLGVSPEVSAQLLDTKNAIGESAKLVDLVLQNQKWQGRKR
jgi:adenylosuccinate lyase